MWWSRSLALRAYLGHAVLRQGLLCALAYEIVIAVLLRLLAACCPFFDLSASRARGRFVITATKTSRCMAGLVLFVSSYAYT